MSAVEPSLERLFPPDPPRELGLVFLIGMPRSGTTWVTWLLTHHPQVVTFRHSGMFFCFDHLQKWWTRDIKYTKGGALEQDGAYALASSAEALDPAELARVLRSVAGHVFERLVRDSPGTRAVVDQTPEHISLWPFVRRVLPEARLLHVVRDPRAVYSSIRSAADSWAAPGSFPRSPIQIARRWRKLLGAARELRDSGDGYHEVFYEKIHAEPQSELERLHRWMGLDTDPELVERSIAASRIDKLRANAKAPTGFFRRGSAGGWRDELSPSEIKVIEHEAGDEMEAWGYELCYPRLAKKPLRLRSYEAVSRLVRRKRGGRVMRLVEGALARTSRTLDLMRSE